MKLLATIFCVLFLISCSSSNPYELPNEKRDNINKKVHKHMGWLVHANPKADAYDALQKGDYRFYEIDRHHYAGVPIYEMHCPKRHENPQLWDKVMKNTKRIDGVSYTGETYEHRKLIAIATEYIEEYNHTLWFHLNETGKFECVK